MRTGKYILMVAMVASCAASAHANAIINGDFSAGLAGWDTLNSVSVVAGEAIIDEDPIEVESRLSQQFVIPAWAQSLSFTHSVASVPPGPVPPAEWPDALLVSLLDPVTSVPLLSNAPFDEFFYHDNGATGMDYDPAIVDVSPGGTVTLDLTSISAGADTDALLMFSVFGQIQVPEFSFQAHIDDVTVTPGGVEIPEPVTAMALTAAICGLGGYLRRRRRK